MANHLAICDVPALPLLIRRADVSFATAAIVRLRDTYNRSDPSAPSIGHLLTRRRLVSSTAAKAVVGIFQRHLTDAGKHVCAACAFVAEHNTCIHNFGVFLQEVSHARSRARSDAVEQIAITSRYSEETIDSLGKRRTVPDYVSQSVLEACLLLYGQRAERFNLAVRRFVPDECKPVGDADSRSAFSDSYMRVFCTPARGCIA